MSWLHGLWVLQFQYNRVRFAAGMAADYFASVLTLMCVCAHEHAYMYVCGGKGMGKRWRRELTDRTTKWEMETQNAKVFRGAEVQDEAHKSWHKKAEQWTTPPKSCETKKKRSETKVCIRKHCLTKQQVNYNLYTWLSYVWLKFDFYGYVICLKQGFNTTIMGGKELVKFPTISYTCEYSPLLTKKLLNTYLENIKVCFFF